MQACPMNITETEELILGKFTRLFILGVVLVCKERDHENKWILLVYKTKRDFCCRQIYSPTYFCVL